MSAGSKRRAALAAALSVAAVVLVAAPGGAAGGAAGAAAPRPLAGKVVGIDPGHNGRNFTDPAFLNHLIWNGRERESCDTTGTETDGGYTEAAFNFHVAWYLARDLRAEGARVVMTRTTNGGVGPCVTTRARILDRARADVAIDIHADGGPPGGRGFAILEPVADGPNDRVIGASRRFGAILRGRYGAVTGIPLSTYDGIHGVAFRSDLAGLNLTTVPKVLIECGNMRNAVDAAQLVRPAFQRRAAQAFAEAITRFLTRRAHRAHRAAAAPAPGAGGAARRGAARRGAARRVVIGHSARGRPIVAWTAGSAAAPRRVLVVGCIHGNECAGLAITSRLRRLPVPRGVQLWIVPEMNPDGTAADTRQNAHGVDLNRNFPYRWRAISDPVYASGPHPASEPETRAALGLVRRIRPAVTIWYHQHMDLVDESGGELGVERRYAQVAGMRPTCLTFLSGEGTRWSNHAFPGTTAFVVELPAGPVAPAALARHLAAVRAVELGQRSGSPTRCDSVTPAA